MHDRRVTRDVESLREPSVTVNGAVTDPQFISALFLLQGVWGLFLIVLAWSVRRVLTEIKDNTDATVQVGKSVHDLNLLLAGNYITKPEYDRLEARLRGAEERIAVTEALVRIKSRGSHGD